MEKKGLVDLHFHSVYSDGSEDIPAVIKEAKKRGVTALALTDHNNGTGVREFMDACKEAGVQSLEGVEIYASFSEYPWSWNPDFCGPVPDVVILGRKLNWEEFRGYREMIIEYWSGYWLPETLKGLKDSGLKVPNLSPEKIWSQVKGSGIPQVLHEVPRNRDNWPRLWEICNGFDSAITMEDIAQNPVRWANRHLYSIGKNAYVLRAPQDWTIKKAVELAKIMDGVLFVAHPGGGFANWSDQHLNKFVEQGGKGIEVYQWWHTETQIKRFLDYAEKHNLLVSGGSDWHGKNGKQALGCWDKPGNQTPFEAFERLLEQLP